jgi:hypothetical protein
MARAANAWLIAEIADGLQRLVVLRLEGAPAADAIEGTVLAWADALAARALWIEERDKHRLREAFRQLAAHATRWPAPAHLLEHLPPARAPQALPRPAPTRDEIERARAAIAHIRSMLRRS